VARRQTYGSLRIRARAQWALTILPDVSIQKERAGWSGRRQPSVAWVSSMRTTPLIVLAAMVVAAAPAGALPSDSVATAAAAELEFAAGTSELTSRSEQVLDRAIDALLREPLAHVVIVAPLHGGEDDAALCLRRADVARAYLAHRGIAVYRISVAAGRLLAPDADSTRVAPLQLVIAADPARVQPSAGYWESRYPVLRIAE
jgi:outer membrane protein OmpA-like peptidoglycan-associated protein